MRRMEITMVKSITSNKYPSNHIYKHIQPYPHARVMLCINNPSNMNNEMKWNFMLRRWMGDGQWQRKSIYGTLVLLFFSQSFSILFSSFCLKKFKNLPLLCLFSFDDEEENKNQVFSYSYFSFLELNSLLDSCTYNIYICIQ